MRESSKFVYSLAALWFAFIPPGVARLLVIAAAGLALFLAWWLTQSPDLVVGVVTDLRPGGARGTLALVDLPWADAVPVLVPPTVAGGDALALHDLILAHGYAVTVDQAGQTLATSIFAVEALGILPMSDTLALLADPQQSGLTPDLNPLGMALIAGLLLVFAHLTLRISSSAMIAGTFAVLTFLGLHLNLNLAEPLLPVPIPLFAALILAGAVTGGVFGYKALLADRWLMGERLTALVLALPLAILLMRVGLLPETVGYILALPIAFLVPVSVPLAAAAMLLQQGFDLDLLQTWLAFGGLLLARLLAVVIGPTGLVSQPARTTFVPDPDERGEFDLADVLHPTRKGP